MPHKLIGAPVSYYSGKARAYLNYKRIPYEEVLSTGDVYRQVILKRVGYPVIPVFITEDDEVYQDTTDIIDYLETKYPNNPVYPSTPLQKFVALLMEVYGDEWLLIPAMHYRWNIPENKEYAIRKFGETSMPEATPDMHMVIGEEIAKQFAGAVPFLGISEKNIDAIEASYIKFLRDFSTHLEKQPFLLGRCPSIGDYGLIGSLYAHLYLDPASGRFMKEHAPKVVDWVLRMHNPQEFDGSFLPDDKIPETVMPLLKRMFSEQVPVLLSTVEHVAQWAKDHPGERNIKRGIGAHNFTVEGVDNVRAVMPASQWMWQRPYDFYHSVEQVVRDQFDTLLEQLPNGLAAFQAPIPKRIVRENYRFCLAPTEH